MTTEILTQTADWTQLGDDDDEMDVCSPIPTAMIASPAVVVAAPVPPQLQRTAKEAQEKLSTIEKAFTQEKQTLDELEHRLSTELADLEAQQQARSAHVEKGLLSRYNSIKASRKDHALAEIKEGICSGCRLQLPPQLISEVKRADDLHTCPYCRRMLYWDGQIPVEATPGPELDKTSALEIGESV